MGGQTGNRRPPTAPSTHIWLHSHSPPPPFLHSPRPITQCGNNNSQTKLWVLPLLSFSPWQLPPSFCPQLSGKPQNPAPSDKHDLRCVHVCLRLCQLWCSFKSVFGWWWIQFPFPCLWPPLAPPSEVWSPTFCWRGAERGSACVCVTARRANSPDEGVGSQNKGLGASAAGTLKSGSQSEAWLGELGAGKWGKGLKLQSGGAAAEGTFSRMKGSGRGEEVRSGKGKVGGWKVKSPPWWVTHLGLLNWEWPASPEGSFWVTRCKSANSTLKDECWTLSTFNCDQNDNQLLWGEKRGKGRQKRQLQ